MREERIFISLVVLLVVLLIILMTGIGYATETGKISDEILILSEQADFKIAFIGEPTYTGNGVAKTKLTGPTTAIMDVRELNSVGDSVTVIFTIENKSRELNANIYTKVSNTNTEYFNVTNTLSDSIIKTKNGKVILKVRIELIKLPIYKEEKADICIDVFAEPQYND